MRSTPIIDIWMQHPTARFLRQPMFDSLLRWMGVSELPEEFPIEFTLGAMDEAGVDIGVLAAWHGPQGALISNEEVAALIDAHPDRFVGLASVNLYHPMEAVRTLRHCVKERGFKGLRLVPWLWNLPPNDRRYYPLFAECVELGVPFFTQVGHTGPLCPSEPGRPIPYLDEVLLDFPELVVVAGHVGYPWEQEVLSLCRKYPNFYIDTSAYKCNRIPDAIQAYLQGRGAKKVLFGSNFPMLSPGQCLASLDELQLDEKSKTAYSGGNAAHLLGIHSETNKNSS